MNSITAVRGWRFNVSGVLVEYFSTDYLITLVHQPSRPTPRRRSRLDSKGQVQYFSISMTFCAPSYLSDACKSAPEASRRLRSSGAITCVILWTRTHLGDRSFDVAGPRLWNKLPALLRSSDNSLPIQKTVENVFVCQELGCGA